MRTQDTTANVQNFNRNEKPEVQYVCSVVIQQCTHESVEQGTKNSIHQVSTQHRSRYKNVAKGFETGIQIRDTSTSCNKLFLSSRAIVYNGFQREAQSVIQQCNGRLNCAPQSETLSCV